MRFLEFATKKPLLWNLVTQVLTFLSHLLEHQLSNSVRYRKGNQAHAPEHPLEVMMIWAVDDEGRGGNNTYFEPGHLNTRLVSYVHGSSAMMKGKYCYGLATDKGTGVGGQCLQNTIFAIGEETGKACMAIPQDVLLLCCYCYVCVGVVLVGLLCDWVPKSCGIILVHQMPL
jgi:hypothetical protein